MMVIDVTVAATGQSLPLPTTQLSVASRNRVQAAGERTGHPVAAKAHREIHRPTRRGGGSGNTEIPVIRRCTIPSYRQRVNGNSSGCPTPARSRGR